MMPIRSRRTWAIFFPLALCLWTLSCGGDRAALHVVVTSENPLFAADLIRVAVTELDGANATELELGEGELQMPARFNFVVQPSSHTAANAELRVHAEARSGGALVALKDEVVRLVPGQVTPLYVKLGDAAKNDPDAGTVEPVPDSGTLEPQHGPDGGVVDPGPPSKLVFRSVPVSTSAGECSQPVTLELRDKLNLRTVALERTVVLISLPPGGVKLFQDASCQFPLTEALIGAGASTFNFHFSAETAVISPVSARATGLETATADLAVMANAPKKIIISSLPQTVQAGACSSRVSITLQDAFGNPVRPSVSVSLGLSSTVAGVTFFSDARVTPTAFAQVPAGADSASFFYKSASGGSVELAVKGQGLETAQQTQSVVPILRRGLCTLTGGLRSVACPVDPPQQDLSKTMLFFQATGSGSAVSETSVRCRLTATNTVTCERQSSQTVTQISWQTAELSTGLRVQTLDVSCAGRTLTSVPIAQVNPAKTFLLYSQNFSDLTYDSDNFVTLELASPTQVDLRSTINCEPVHRSFIQVVEMDGVSVTRGYTGPMTNGLTAGNVGLPAVNLASTVLLHTARVNATGTIMCDRMVRGELNSPTSVSFTRAAGMALCNGATVDTVVWERIDFGARGKAQQVNLFAPEGGLTGTANIAPVDPSRTLLFSSSQGQSGQSGGEGTFAGNDTLGSWVGILSLPSPTVLRVDRGRTEGASRWTSYVLQLEPL